MKRTELRIGREYAMLSPSQEIGLFESARRIRVLDTDPVWSEAYSTFGGQDKRPRVNILGFEDAGTVEAIDTTKPVGTYESDKRQAKASVKALTVSRYSEDYYRVEVVPLAQIRMEWSEYAQRVASNKRAAKRADKKRKAEDAKRALDKAEAKARRERDIATVREFLATTAHPTIGGARVAFNRLHPEARPSDEGRVYGR